MADSFSSQYDLFNTKIKTSLGYNIDNTKLKRTLGYNLAGGKPNDLGYDIGQTFPRNHLKQPSLNDGKIKVNFSTPPKVAKTGGIDKDEVFKYFSGTNEEFSNFFKNGGKLENYVEGAKIQRNAAQNFKNGLEANFGIKETPGSTSPKSEKIDKNEILKYFSRTNNGLSEYAKNGGKLENYVEGAKIQRNAAQNFKNALETNFGIKETVKNNTEEAVESLGKLGKWKGVGMVAGAVALGGLALNAASNKGQLSNAQLYGQRPLY